MLLAFDLRVRAKIMSVLIKQDSAFISSFFNNLEKSPNQRQHFFNGRLVDRDAKMTTPMIDSGSPD
jgi:hypothetical protein